MGVGGVVNDVPSLLIQRVAKPYWKMPLLPDADAATSTVAGAGMGPVVAMHVDPTLFGASWNPFLCACGLLCPIASIDAKGLSFCS